MNAPLVPIGTLAPPLFCRTRPLPTSPVTVPPTVNVLVVQVTVTLVTALDVTPPVPLVTTHVCHGVVGWVWTVTAYVPPLATAVAKVNEPLVVTLRVSLPLSCSARPVPTSPVTVPPIVYVFVVQAIATSATSVAPTTPVPRVTTHVWLGVAGCVSTVTA